jgi:hypothetical protein
LGCEAVFSILADDHSMEEIVFGESGLLSALAVFHINIRKIAVPRAGCNPWAELSRLDSKVFVLSIYYRSMVREISRTVGRSGPSWFNFREC